jgi:hypothetical protein
MAQGHRGLGDGLGIEPIARRALVTNAKPRALSRRRLKPSGIGVPERVHFTEF